MVPKLAKWQLGNEYIVVLACLLFPEDLEHSQLVSNRVTELRNSGILVERIGKNNLPIMALKLKTIIKKYSINVIHSHMLTGNLLLSLIGARTFNIYTHHNTPIKINNSIFKIVSRRIDKFVSISTIGKRYLDSASGLPSTVILNGTIEHLTSTGSIDNSAGKMRKEFKILSAGNLFHQKNYPLAIKIVKRLVDHDLNNGGCLKYQIAGDGDKLNELTNMIENYDLKEHIQLLGMVDNVPELMINSDLYLLTSHYEGLPISLIEALEHGLPIVAADVGGCSDIVTNGYNGKLINPGDVDAFYQAIVVLRDTPGLLEKYSNNAKIKAEQFTLERCATSYHKLYMEGVSK